MPNDDLPFLPLFNEDEDSVGARRNAVANRDVDPGDLENMVDVRPLSHYQMITEVFVQEGAMLWDAISVDVPSAAFPTRAWGDYLDEWAAALGLDPLRKDAIKATGTVLFTGTEGTLVPNQVQLSAIQTDPDIDPPEFVTTESGVISTTLDEITDLAAAQAVGGALANSSTFYYVVVATNEYGETLASNEVNAATDNGAGTHHAISLTWSAVDGATGYNVYRSNASGSGAKRYLASVVGATYTDTGDDATTTRTLPSENGTGGFFRASIEAADAGKLGNVGPDAITNLLTPITGVDSVTNDEATENGADEESDEELRVRVLLAFQGSGGGNIADHMKWALAWPGIGRVTVIPIVDGPGTVGVMIMTADGDPVSTSVVDDYQRAINPLPEQGGGIAPVGQTVIVKTPERVLIDVVSDIDFESGYSLDGTSGTVNLRSNIEAALSNYIDSLEAGEDVIRDHVLAQVYSVEGVYKVNSLTIEGGTADVAINSTTPQVAALGTVTLT